MRLALISQDFPPKIGGIQTYALELGLRFHKALDFFCVIAPDVPGAAQTDKELPFPVYRISSTEPMLGWMAVPELPPVIRQHGVDTIFHTQWNTLPASVWMRKLGIIERIFVAVHGRELLFNPFGDYSGSSQLYNQYRNHLLKFADGFFPVSHFTASLVEQEGISPNKISVVPNGTDPDKYYPKDGKKLKSSLGLNDKKVLLTITRLVSRKGIDTVLKALPEVLKKFPDACYVIAGDGEDREILQELAIELEIQNQVLFAGKIPAAQLSAYYSMADVFVMPSKSEFPDVEGFGLVFLEANACETPVIGSKSGGIPDAIVHEKTGLLVPEQVPGALAESIIRMFKNPQWAAQLGKNGRQRILREANWDTASSSILKTIKTGFSNNFTPKKNP